MIALEELVTHMQHELSQMHEVLLAQRDEIAELRRAVARLSGEFEQLVEGAPFPSPLEDRPPHY